MATIDILGVPHAYDLTAPTTSVSSGIAKSTTQETPTEHTLVFIHGWLLSRRYWQPLIERLAPDYQCLCYDLRGFGDSQPTRKWGVKGSARRRREPDAAHWRPGKLDNAAGAEPVGSCYTPAAYVADLVVLLKQLGISSAWLIGHSLGGSIALWGASIYPECVRGVVCVNSGGGIYLKEEFERFRTAGEQIVKWRPRWISQLPLIDLLFARAQVARPIARYWGRQRLIDFAVAHPEAALGTLLDSTTEDEVHRLPELVSRLEQPVYLALHILGMMPTHAHNLNWLVV
ncbi:MAG: alpha/beta hydrolase [Hormoscilla sp. GM7CHS1pb]|nr:alpha/beta hydrolase [Hormoscilla sp. GM7CHS1pb]